MISVAETSQAVLDEGYIPVHVLRAIAPAQSGAIGAPNEAFTAQERYNAALAWSVTGSPILASAICGVPAPTISLWANRADWWPLAVETAMRGRRASLDGRMQGLLERALDQIEDRLIQGDVTLHQGVAVRHPVRARDVTVLAAILYDKLCLHRGMATSRVERVNLGALRGELRQVVEGEFTQSVSTAPDPQSPTPTQSES